MCGGSVPNRLDSAKELCSLFENKIKIQFSNNGDVSLEKKYKTFERVKTFGNPITSQSIAPIFYLSFIPSKKITSSPCAKVRDTVDQK